MFKNSIKELHRNVAKSKIAIFSQEKLNDLIMSMDLKDLTTKSNFEKLVAVQNVFEKRSMHDANSKLTLDILHLLYARILSESNSKKSYYIKRVLDLLKDDSVRFSQAIQDLIMADSKSAERFANLTNKISERLDSLDRNVLNAYLQNAMNSGAVNLESSLGKRTLKEILSKNQKVTLTTRQIASKILNFSAPEVHGFHKKKAQEVRSFQLINIMLGFGSLLAFIGLITGLVVYNMLLVVGSLFLFVSFWGAGHFNKSLHEIQMRAIIKEKGKSYLINNNKNEKEDINTVKKVKKISSLRKLIRTNHNEFEKNLAKYEKSLLKDARKVYN